jgi:hypothetical protein
MWDWLMANGQQVTSVGTILAALAGLLTAIAALWQTRITRDALVREQKAEIALTFLADQRPGGGWVYSRAVVNAGRAAALNVRVAGFDARTGTGIKWGSVPAVTAGGSANFGLNGNVRPLWDRPDWGRDENAPENEVRLVALFDDDANVGRLSRVFRETDANRIEVVF